MILDFLILGGYGQYVWPAFIFTFASCFILYVKTQKELSKLEKIFLSENIKFQNVKIKVAKERENIKAVLSGGSF